MNKKIVLITGAGKGLGLIISRRLVSYGYKVYGTYLKSNTNFVKGVTYFKLDITSDYQCKSLVENIMKIEKRIDILINCAGISVSKPTLDFSPREFNKVLDTNVVGAFRMIQSVQNCGPSFIINISSLCGFLSLPNFGVYSASKFGLEALSSSLNFELASKTRVVTISPGALLNENSAKRMAHKPLREKIPLLNHIIPLTSMDQVANVIYRVISGDITASRVIVGRDAKIIYLIQKIFPESIFRKIILFIWQRK